VPAPVEFEISLGDECGQVGLRNRKFIRRLQLKPLPTIAPPELQVQSTSILGVRELPLILFDQGRSNDLHVRFFDWVCRKVTIMRNYEANRSLG
jgi:hypothetical protein